MPPSVPSRSMASSTFSRLCAGSPMPMKTTFFTARMRRASTTWARISMLVTCRIRPLLPVMQKRQPTAQPTWVETQSPSRGSSTLSTICPSANSTSRREPSLPACSDRTRARSSSSAVRAGTALRSASGRKCWESRRRVPWSSGWPCSQTRMSRPRCGQGIEGGETLVESRRGAWGKRRATPCAGRLACAVERIDELADYALADTKSLGTQCVSRLFVNGGAEEDRTPDLRIANATLSQLSYRPKSSKTETIQENSRAVQKRWKFLFEGQRGDHRRVVRGLFVAARFLVDVAGHAALDQRRRQQHMVDAQAGIAAEAELAVIPPAEGLLGLREQAEGIGQARSSRARKALRSGSDTSTWPSHFSGLCTSSSAGATL